MATLQIIPDENDASSVIVLKTNKEEHLYKVNTSELMQAANSVEEIALDDGKVVLSITSPDEIKNGENIIINQTVDSASLTGDLPILLQNGNEYVFETVKKESENTQNVQVSKTNSKGRIQAAKNSFKCNHPGCGKVIIGIELLKAHAMQHSNLQSRQYKCIVESCEWSFKSMYKLNRHLESHLGMKQYICDVEGCNRQCTTAYNLKNHKKNVHERPLTFTCDICDEKFATKYFMEVHSKKHEEAERPYQCPIENCGKRFHVYTNLSLHLRKHQVSESELTCWYEGCNKVYENYSRLKQHFRQHTGERPYVCTYQGCKWSFATASKLARHARKHTGERKHVCPHENCKKAFMRPEHLKEHIISHTNTRSFVCPHQGCQAKFSAKSSLYVHTKKHKAMPKEKGVYVCPFDNCQQEYDTKVNLKSHLSQHLNPLSADGTSVESPQITKKKSGPKAKTKEKKGEKSVKVFKCNTIDQFGYFALLSNDEQQEITSLDAATPTTAAGTSEFQAAINSITGGPGSSSQEAFAASISAASQPTIQASPMKCVVNEPLQIESSIENLPVSSVSSSRTNSLSLDVTSIPSSSDTDSATPSRVRQENYSGSARTDYCCARANIRKTRPVKKQNVDFPSEAKSEDYNIENTNHKRKGNSSTNKIGTAVISPVPDLTLAPTDVVLTSGAITFRDPTTGAHFVQTQLLQDDPPCVITDVYSELLQDEITPCVITDIYSGAQIIPGDSSASQPSVSSDFTVVPVSLLSENIENLESKSSTDELSNTTINLHDLE